MTPERWERVEQLFEAALEQPEGLRAAYLGEACGGDHELRREVESLLVHGTQTDEFLQSAGAGVIAASLLAQPDPSLIGKTVSHYRVLEQLGAGGMGMVYKARDLTLRRTVALKFLICASDMEAEDRERLLREARAASVLDHPNIAAVYAVEETADGRMFIVMGYYEGISLDAKIRTGTISTAQAIAIAKQITEGLAHAHARKVIHRDIKPSNVIITTEGVAKIVDFGLARVITASASTLSQDFAGTLAYMSPEHAAGKPLDGRSDLWSLGVLLYQMLTGRLPFQGDSPAAIVAAILNSTPPPIGGISPELQFIVDRTLSKRPEARYQSCSQFLQDLESVAAGDTFSTAAGNRLRPQNRIRLTAGTRALTVLSARWSWIFAAMAVLSLAIWLLVFPFRHGLLPRYQPLHIVVLPFDTAGGNAGSENLANGLMESITGKLANLEAGQQSLWVVPATEVRSRKVADANAAKREFGATMAIQGSLRQEQNGLWLMLSLIDTGTLRLLGSASLEEKAGDLSLLEDDAVSRLVALMHIPLSSDTHRSAGAKPVPAAYESYLKGLGLLQRFDRAGNLDTAVALFESAVHTDPEFALGYAALGEAYWDKYRLDQNSHWVDQAAAYCQRAAEINDQLPAVYVTLGRIHNGTGQHDLALQEFQKALQLEHTDPDALLGLAQVYESMGRFQEADNAYKRAAALRPDYWDGYQQLGVFYYRQHRYADAATQFRRVLELTPDNAQAHSNLGVMLRNLGQDSEAELQFKKSIDLYPGYGAYANLGFLYYRQKRYAESVAMTEKALQLNDKDYLVWANLGLAYQWLQQPVKATRAFDEELGRLEQTVRLRPEDPAVQCEIGLLYARRHARHQALPHLEAALARSPDDPLILSDAAEAYNDLGDRNRALALVAKAVNNGRALEEMRDPDIQPLLSEPALADLLKKRGQRDTAAAVSPNP